MTHNGFWYLLPAGILAFVSTSFAQEHGKFPPIPELAPEYVKVTTRDYSHGGLKIRVTNGKTDLLATRDLRPRFRPDCCAGWFSIFKKGKEIYRHVNSEFEPVGGAYGFFVPTKQPSERLFVIVMCDEYDDRMFIINKAGRLWNVSGSSYFVTKDKRYIVAGEAADLSGITIYDMNAEIVAYSTFGETGIDLGEELPFYPYRWFHSKKLGYFCTESTWVKGEFQEPHETLHVLSIETGAFTSVPFDQAEFDKATPVLWDFDPGEYAQCSCSEDDQPEGK